MEQGKNSTEKEAQANEAAAAGDISLYRQYKAEAEAMAESIFVKRAQLRKNGGTVKQEDVSAFWKKYATDHKKRMEKAIKEIEQKQAELWEAFNDAVQLQNEALKIKKRCGFFVGAKAPELIVDFEKNYSMFPLALYMDKDESDKLIRYYRQLGKMQSFDDMTLYSTVVNIRAPYPND